MAAQTRGERRLDEAIAHVVTPRAAAIVIAVASTAITLMAGVLMTLIDHDQFPSFGAGMWWAVQTVTTVGYGDHVPTRVLGRVLAAVVMLLGIGFITVITASITSSLVARSRPQQPLADIGAISATLSSLEERLERIEAALDDRK